MCDKTFGRRYSLRRHVDSIHADEKSEGDEQVYNDPQIGAIQPENDNFKPTSKKRRVEEIEMYESDSTQGENTDESYDSDSESETVEEDTDESDRENDDESSDKDGSSELEENTAYRDWLAESKEATEEMWSQKYKKYINEGLSDDQSKEKAERKMLWAVKKIFFNNFKDFLSSYLSLKDDETFQDIVVELEEKRDEGVAINKALKRVLTKYQSKFDGLFNDDSDDEGDND